MRAKDVLLEALQSYTGTVVFVSHDRYFIDQLATRIFEVGGGRVEIYPGNYEDYRRRKEQLAPPGEPAPEPAREAASLPEPAGSKPRRLNPILLRQLRRRVEEIEEQIARTEAALAECEQELAIFRSAEESRRLAARASGLRAELDALYQEWEQVSSKLEEHSVA
jgi:ATP-binding cassette subfamily F protein 3